MELKDLIKRQLQTEKSTRANGLNKYTLLVDPRVNRAQLRDAIETAFKVDVEKVNLLKAPPARRYLARYRRLVTNPALKKAVLTLKKGQHLDLTAAAGKKEAKK